MAQMHTEASKGGPTCKSSPLIQRSMSNWTSRRLLRQHHSVAPIDSIWNQDPFKCKGATEKHPILTPIFFLNIARVRNCPDVTISISLFGLCLFVFLPICVFCHFVILSSCPFVFFPFFLLSFCLFVFLSLCLFVWTSC